MLVENIFHTSECSDDPSSFISESESISVRGLWYTWPKNRLVDSWKFVLAPDFVEHRIVHLYVKCTKGHNLR